MPTPVISSSNTFRHQHMRHASDLNITFPTPPIATTKNGTGTPTRITYTQNGNHLAHTAHQTQLAQHDTYRWNKYPLPTRRPQELHRVVNVITTRRLQQGRARVCLHQPTINVLRPRPSLPSSYNNEQLKQQRNRIAKHTLTPYVIPGPELARATQR